MALDAFCAPSRAKRMLEKLELHNTPRHGSSFNLAEIGFSVLARQYLDRRIAVVETLCRQVSPGIEPQYIRLPN